MTIESAKRLLTDLARDQVGYCEGANNYNKYAAEPMIERLYGWMPQNQPWCCVFVNWCFLTAFGYDIGSRLTYGGTAACYNSSQLFRQNGAFTKTPEVGDQAFYYSGSGINHTGIVVEVTGNSFTAVEGNYSDKVSYVRHQITGSDVAGFGRPNWKIVSGADQSNAVTNPDNPVNSGDTKPKEDLSDYEHHDWKPLLLSYGSTGVDVAILQGLLTAHLFGCGGIDGEFGPNTRAAVRAAQTFYKIAVDGIAGKDTFSALGLDKSLWG